MKKTPLLCTGHSRPVPFFSYSDLLEDGSFYISSSCLDGKPMLRDGKTGDWIGTFSGHKGAVWSSQINPTGTLVATASADYTAKVWNAITGEEVQSFAHNCVVKTSEFSGSTKVVTGGMDKTLRVYDLEKPQNDPTCGQVGDNLKRILCPSSIDPSGNLSLCLTSSGNVLVWDLRSMEKVQQLAGSCSNLGLTADKKKLVTVGAGQIMVWDAATFQQEKVFSVPNSVVCASVDSGSSPSLVVTGGSDNWIRVFDYASKKEVEVIKGHHGPVNCVSFSPDGQTYASGSDDGTIRIWLAKEMAYGVWELGDPTSSSSSSSSSSPSFQSEPTERRRRPSDHAKRSPNRANSSSHKNLAFHNNGKSRGGGWDTAPRGEGGK